MRIERFNPPQLQPTQGVTHVVRVTGGSTLYPSGQVPLDAENNLVGPGTTMRSPDRRSPMWSPRSTRPARVSLPW